MAKHPGGRPPQPAALKLLKGNGIDKDQGGRPVNLGPGFERGAPEPPDNLGPLAREEWDRIVPTLSSLDLLKPEDYTALVEHCTTWQQYNDAVALVNEKGILIVNPDSGMAHRNPALTASITLGKELRNSCHEFGLTPSAEQRLGRPMEAEPTGDDPFADTTHTG